MAEPGKYICLRCNVPMEPSPVTLDYRGNSITADFPRCPECGQVFIPEEVARGRMHSVEIELEDK